MFGIGYHELLIIVLILGLLVSPVFVGVVLALWLARRGNTPRQEIVMAEPAPQRTCKSCGSSISNADQSCPACGAKT